ncbi:hypothetical protein LR48_Vigan07g226300 [Vigna angularis]|uniref:Retrotransposon gag domain-containing protein n=1 Tax=Phaseolus angularis TaxID=3914 RepID=A0A0L9V1E3_PHAAN|nr:hypothetical protein LR48_Vigan07g226300 [Vigna angularis]
MQRTLVQRAEGDARPAEDARPAGDARPAWDVRLQEGARPARSSAHSSRREDARSSSRSTLTLVHKMTKRGRSSRIGPFVQHWDARPEVGRSSRKLDVRPEVGRSSRKLDLLQGASMVEIHQFPPSNPSFLDVDETLGQACDRFKGLLRKTPTHGFDEPTMLNLFLGGLKSQTKLMLDASAGEQSTLSNTLGEENKKHICQDDRDAAAAAPRGFNGGKTPISTIKSIISLFYVVYV